MSVPDFGVNVEIDPLRLEEEWMRHPQMVLNICTKVAELQYEYDQAKFNLNQITANLNRDIRESPAQYGISKVTESAIEISVQTQPEYAAAVKKLNEASHYLQLANAASNALEHRKRALTCMVDLWVKDYYSDMATMPRTDALSDAERREVRSRGRRRREQTQLEDGDGG